MVTRNSNNTVDFGHFGGIAQDVSCYTVDGGATLAAEINPGEAMEAIVELIQSKATILAMGAEDGAGGFRIMLQNSGWDADTLQVALRALGGGTVGNNSYNISAATATAFTF